MLACWAAAWLAVVAVAEVPKVDWPAEPATETFWPNKLAVIPPPPEALTPPMPTTVPEIVPAVAEMLAVPPDRTVPLKLCAALTVEFCRETISPRTLP